MSMRNLGDSVILPRSGIEIRNRSVLAALTNKQSNDDGTLSESEIKWLERRSRDGFGLVTTAAAFVHPSGKSWDGELGVHSDLMLPGLTELANRIRNHGALGLVQIFHGGMRAPSKITGLVPISSGDNSTNLSSTNLSRSMSGPEIEAAVEWFVDAAVRCSEAGFDGVEIHGAHGYLITQFMGSKTNKRRDRWGGSLDARALFLLEIVRRIRKNVPRDFIISVRLSPEHPSCGISIEDSLKISKMLVDEDVDILHISCWDIRNRTKIESTEKPLTQIFSDELGDSIPLITTGSIWIEEDVNEAFRQGASLVGVGRAGIAYPDWPLRVFTSENRRPPFSEEHLADADLSPRFIEYMRMWDGFVDG